jgi:predicted TIM-barrel fold metal-dependent hydrolase
MAFIDAHVHVWTDDTSHYPLGAGWKKEVMKPGRFTPEDLFKHTKPAGVDRFVLIQMSYYYPIPEMLSKNENEFDNSYMIDMIKLYEGVFVGTAVIDPHGKEAERLMGELAKKGVRAFRIHPKLSKQPAEKWLRSEGYGKMFAAAARNNQALSCLIDPDGLPELDRMCSDHGETPVIVDHLARIGADGTVRDKDVDALCALAKHKKAMVKVGAFYALGKKQPPYADLVPLIKKVVKAFGPERCMWESDCPFQVQGEHSYKASIDLVRTGLDFLSADDRAWLLGKTAEKLFFAK